MVETEVQVPEKKPTALSWRAMDRVEKTVSMLFVGGLAALLVVFGLALEIASRMVL